MSSSLIRLVSSINDNNTAKLRITLNSGEPAQLDCVFKAADAPLFRLIFPPKKPVPEELEVSRSYIIEIVTGNSPLIFKAAVETFHDDFTIMMRATDHIDPASSRDLPRVELSTTITAFSKRDDDDEQEPWEITGSTIDLSATGVLCIFPKQLEDNSTISVKIDLPGIEKQVTCLAQVVRTRKVRNERYQTALYFNPITKEDSDTLLSACLHEQRNQLRSHMDGR